MLQEALPFHGIVIAAKCWVTAIIQVEISISFIGQIFRLIQPYFAASCAIIGDGISQIGLRKLVDNIKDSRPSIFFTWVIQQVADSDAIQEDTVGDEGVCVGELDVSRYRHLHFLIILHLLVMVNLVGLDEVGEEDGHGRASHQRPITLRTSVQLAADQPCVPRGCFSLDKLALAVNLHDGVV